MTQDKFKTMHNVFDNFTNLTLFKLISQGHFEGLEGPVSIGKEANIFTAKKGDGKVIVKIYRLEACDFNRMYDYIKEDSRYINLKGKKRKIIFAWVQREFRNLMKAREAGVRVPTPLTFANNILVLEMIGQAEPASKLKDEVPKDKQAFLDAILDNMALLNKAGLVHADLSPFNILNDREKPVFIDFSQCTPLDSTRFEEFLTRDLRNIHTFFKKVGLDVDIEEMRAKVTRFQRPETKKELRRTALSASSQ
ncbi:MAG: serine protein kinase RIO [Nanoarchaeota archaeon]|nr:serine protein kinase RIO [Nanoarchaeota archaeon]